MKRFREREKKGFITTRIIALGFLGAIVAGTLLLMLPFSTVEGETTTVVDALFTSTTSVCVTGLVVVPTYSHWTLFGQMVIALLAQVGGLGVITFTMLFFMALHRRIGLKDRLLIQAAYNLDTIQGLVILVKKIVRGTLLVEGIGALFYMTVFVPEYGIIGIWKSIFNSISAFCNAGMDVLGPNSLEPYAGNPVVNITTMLLIILGGIGFPVWWNLMDFLRNGREKYGDYPMALRHLQLHTKLVLFVTAVLIFTGALAVFFLEYNNPATLGNLPLLEKVQASVFQSVTTRTAGFATISQAGLSEPTMLICCMLMFIGGSPSGTAGGIKTTTVAILVVTVYSIIRSRRDTEMFGRRVSSDVVRRALSVFMVSFGVMLAAVIALTIVQPGAFVDCLYETVSAIATVGLSRDFTSSLTLAGRIIIIITMYIGRIGPISLALFFNSRRYVNLKSYPEEKVTVG
ncbi:MAG: potassium transporter KtrB [Lachnospiraceae bacterium]|nr:potassium transporter KtrB [Lachnospiraceae bacterium]